MKKLALFLLLLISTVAFAQQKEQNEWQNTSCYSKIQFKLKYEGKNGDRHVWKVQFKSSYETVISFNYHISDESGQYEATTHRKVLNPGTVSAEIETYTDSENIFLTVDKVSLSPYPNNFIDCE